MCIYLFNSFLLLLSSKFLLLSTTRILINIYIYALYYLHMYNFFIICFAWILIFGHVEDFDLLCIYILYSKHFVYRKSFSMK